MRISILGTGYVGLVSGAGFAKMGHDVICVDRNPPKVEMINKGKPPIFEEGLEGLLREVAGKKLKATGNVREAVMNSDITFICVGTPSRDDGSINLEHVENAAAGIGEVLKDKKYHVVVVKSTVVPGTTEGIVLEALEKASGKKVGRGFGLGMNPEFLREGVALKDFLEPDRIVIGEIDRRSGDLIEQTYRGFDAPVMRTDIKTAEMVKYASNAFLSSKISFSNEIGNMCKKLGIDTYEVFRGVGMDHRISPSFFGAGIGFGGSCFKKDVMAIAARARELGEAPRILDSVLKVNEEQPARLLAMLKEKLGGLEGKNVAVLGLAFKAGTDDIRDSQAIPFIQELLDSGAVVSAYDPQAADNMKEVFPKLDCRGSVKDALEGADACVIATNWDEFKSLTDKDFSVMNNKVIIEGRKTLDPKKVKGFEGICW